MTRRVVVGLIDSSQLAAVRSDLRALGLTTVEGPRPELPDVLVVTPQSEDAAEQVAEEVQRLEGVSYAEVESISEGFIE
ncbi:S8 family serine peptidase [Nocardioides insulae]|uniref:S8 family serine peptidase n=1 Tax=Nocardioides insulae TaxID=394734 RepID=UPI003CCB75D7